MKFLLRYTFILSLFLSCTNKIHKEIKNTKIVLNALTDFQLKQTINTVPFYKDKRRNALAINAVKFKNKFALAYSTFMGNDGVYQINLTTLKETDGESTYSILLNHKVLKEFKNDETTNDFEPQVFNIKNIPLKKNDIIEVKFNTHSNGKIPENGDFAFSRGRWRSIEFILVN